MPIERVPSDDQRVKDIEQARANAEAQKPVRDLAREKSISAEEKVILDNLAERRGEKAGQEYVTEKERNPVERLVLRLDKIAVEMKEKGLEPDAKIVEKLKERFVRYSETLRKNKEVLEESLNKRVSFQELQKADYKYRVEKSILVTDKIGETGGRVCSLDSKGFSFDKIGKAKKTIKDFKKISKKLGKVVGNENIELINFSFSKQGETEFYRALGVLGENEEVIDIPTIYPPRDYLRSGESYLRYQSLCPTNLEGVGLVIEKGTIREYRGKTEDRVALEFSDEFLETIFSKK